MRDSGWEEKVDLRCPSQELYEEWHLSWELNDKWHEPCDSLKISVKSRKVKLFGGGWGKCKMCSGKGYRIIIFDRFQCGQCGWTNDKCESVD